MIIVLMPTLATQYTNWQQSSNQYTNPQTNTFTYGTVPKYGYTNQYQHIRTSDGTKLPRLK
jgi:hypothetical protein